MPLSVIREATDEDVARLEAAAKRFCERHDIELDELAWSALSMVEATLAVTPGDHELERSRRQYLGRLWLAAFRRAVRHRTADTYAYGHIGWWVD